MYFWVFLPSSPISGAMPYKKIKKSLSLMIIGICWKSCLYCPSNQFPLFIFLFSLETPSVKHIGFQWQHMQCVQLWGYQCDNKNKNIYAKTQVWWTMIGNPTEFQYQCHHTNTWQHLQWNHLDGKHTNVKIFIQKCCDKILTT